MPGEYYPRISSLLDPRTQQIVASLRTRPAQQADREPDQKAAAEPGISMEVGGGLVITVVLVLLVLIIAGSGSIPPVQRV